MIEALELDEKIGESGSEIRENVNISKIIHAIYTQPSRILCLTSDHIVLKYGANCTVTF